jgi:hypothetical protein
MVKAKVFASVLILFLVLSVSVNFYEYNQSLASNEEKNSATTKLEMSNLLTQVRLQVDAELEILDSSLALSCAQLATTDLQSSQARSLLSELAANNSLIVNAATSDANDILLAVEPSQYSNIEGENISSQEQNIQMHQTMRPAMSEMILLVEGFYGVVVVAPIWGVNGTLVGSLSLVIQPYELLKSAVLPAIEGTPFAIWAMQVNGTLLYDPDPVQQGKNLFTDPIYVNYPTVQAFTHQVADAQTGYGTYQYHQDTVAGELVNKEAYWTTAGIYGSQWRLVIVHVLNA